MCKKKLLVTIALLGFFFISAITTSDVMAEGWGSTGGTGANGSTSGGGESSVNCTSLTHDRCNRWIKVPIDTFKTAWANRKKPEIAGYSEEAYNTCINPNQNTDLHVVFAGQFPSSSSQIMLWNLYPKPSYLSRNYKLANANGEHDTAYDYGKGFRDFFGDETAADPDLTYKELMDLVMSNMGLSGSDGEARLAFFCQGMVNTASAFTSRSTVITKGQTSASAWNGSVSKTYTTTSGSETVSFVHEIKRNDPNTAEASTTWTVTSSGSTPVTVSSPNTNTTTFAAGETKIVHTTNSITVSVAENSSVTVCQTIDTGPSQACVTFERGGEIVEVKKCDLPNSSYTLDFGGTQAQSGVINLSKPGSQWKTTDGKSSTPAFVWARPGDSIRFKHTLCFGAQSVRGNNTENSPNGSSRTETPNTANTATIRAFTAPGSSGNHLFGTSLSGTSSQTFNLTKGAARPAQASRADEKGDYWFSYYSPGNNANSTYGCNTNNLGFPKFETDGYQIPDFTSTTIPADCNSAKKVPTASDAGKVIEQDLEWNNVRSWLTTQSSGSVTSCGCGDGEPSLPTITSASYGTTSFSTAVGSHKGGCESDGGCGWCSRTANYKSYDYWYYPMTTAATTGATQKAQVKIPFNYTTTPNVSTDQSILYPGGEYGVNVTININERENRDVAGDDDPSYATISKKSVYEIVAFTVAPDIDHTQIAHKDDKFIGTSSRLACNYYGKNSTCRRLTRKESVSLNDEGSLNGATENLFSSSLAIPDAEIGTKFCVAVAVWPSDSHNFTTGPAGVNDTALKDNTGSFWHYSEPTCRTISKKPTTQFRSAGIYTKGGITTSQSKKAVGYSLSNGEGLKSDNVQGGVRNVFGSFSEYEIIANGQVIGMASGAGFGYGAPTRGNLAGSPALPGGYPGVPHTNTEADPCTYSTQTFNNSECAGSSNPNLGSSDIHSSSDTIINRLASRYTNTGSSATTQAPGNIDFSKVSTQENGIKNIKIDGNAVLYGKNLSCGETIIIDVSGTLTIRGNITYGGCRSGSYYDNISQLPQMLIFAGEIRVEQNVTNIDSWLIAGQKGSGSGIINTCSSISASQIENNYTIPARPTGPRYAYDLKCTSQLRVNGPVFARQLILNRIAGAGSGNNNSISPAEIFNLRPDTYLWAYDQASRYSQAVTVYSREVAPRY